MSKFQVILLSVFGFFIIAAVIVFALYRGGSSSEATVTVWGDIPAEDFNLLLNTTAPTRTSKINLRYVEVPTESINEEFTEALAQGGGPDLLITTQDKFWQNKSKLLAIPYASVGERDFKETFIEEGELFLAAEGIYGLPLSVDPMVLYYNRDHLSSAGQAKPLSYWDELYASASRLTKRDGAGNITASAIALGETRNIPHAKDILSLLMLQAGTPITSYASGGLRAQLNSKFDLPVLPGEAALDFYTQFSDPAKPFYSWNRTLSDAQTHFASSDTAYYLGFASELRQLRSKSPTLNFGVARVPQSRVAGRNVTYGSLRAVAISRGTRNPSAALEAALELASEEMVGPLSQILLLPPARRDLLSDVPDDAILPIFYEAALQAKGWLDPNDAATEGIFNGMIEDIISGRARTLEAVNDANRKLEALIRQ